MLYSKTALPADFGYPAGSPTGSINGSTTFLSSVSSSCTVGMQRSQQTIHGPSANTGEPKKPRTNRRRCRWCCFCARGHERRCGQYARTTRTVGVSCAPYPYFRLHDPRRHHTLHASGQDATIKPGGVFASNGGGCRTLFPYCGTVSSWKPVQERPLCASSSCSLDSHHMRWMMLGPSRTLQPYRMMRRTIARMLRSG